MDLESQQKLFRLIVTRRTAALGTLREGAPNVSLVLFAPSDDFTVFLIHISRLAIHTRDILSDPRVGLMIAEPEQPGKDPQTLARVSILGEAQVIPVSGEHYERYRSEYLTRYPEAAVNFLLADFSLYQIAVKSARYVADFGKIFNLRLSDFRRTAAMEMPE